MTLVADFLLAFLAARGAAQLRHRPVWLALLLAWSLALPALDHLRTARYLSPAEFQVPAQVLQARPRLALDFVTVPFLVINDPVAHAVPTLVVYDPVVPRRFFEAVFASQLGPLSRLDKVAKASALGNMIPIIKPDLPLMRAFNLGSYISYREGAYAIAPQNTPGSAFLVGRLRVVEDGPAAWAWAARPDWDPAAEALVARLPTDWVGEVADSGPAPGQRS